MFKVRFSSLFSSVSFPSFLIAGQRNFSGVSPEAEFRAKLVDYCKQTKDLDARLEGLVLELDALVNDASKSAGAVVKYMLTLARQANLWGEEKTPLSVRRACKKGGIPELPNTGALCRLEQRIRDKRRAKERAARSGNAAKKSSPAAPAVPATPATPDIAALRAARRRGYELAFELIDRRIRRSGRKQGLQNLLPARL